MKCLCATARRTARLLNQRYEAELRPAGMTPAQFELLSTVAAHGGVSPGVLAHALDLDPTTLSRNLALLTRRGWIRSEADARDQRRTLRRLTEDGEAALQVAVLLWEQVQTSVQRDLGDEEPAVWSVLSRLAEAAAR